jgi:hypothetical protein
LHISCAWNVKIKEFNKAALVATLMCSHGITGILCHIKKHDQLMEIQVKLQSIHIHLLTIFPLSLLTKAAEQEKHDSSNSIFLILPNYF